MNAVIIMSHDEPVDHNEYNFMAEKSEIITYHANYINLGYEYDFIYPHSII